MVKSKVSAVEIEGAHAKDQKDEQGSTSTVPEESKVPLIFQVVGLLAVFALLATTLSAIPPPNDP